MRSGDAMSRLGTPGGLVDPSLPDAKLVDTVRRVDPGYGDQSTAAYHQFKHDAGELPPSHRAPGLKGEAEMSAYITSAKRVVRDPASKATVKVDQLGNKAIHFEQTIEGHAMTAIVGVDHLGNATLLTYMGKKP